MTGTSSSASPAASLLRGWLVYTLSSGINAAVPLLIIPVLTRYLTPADYGIVAMMGVLITTVTPFVGLSLHGAIAVKYYDKSTTDLAGYVGTCLLILAATSLLVLAAMMGFADAIAAATAFPSKWLPVIVVIALTQFVAQVLLTIWQMQERPLAFAAFQTAQTILNIGLTVWLVAGWQWSWQGRVYAHAATAVIAGGVALLLLWRGGWLRFRPEREAVVHAVNFGIPLIPHALGSAVTTQIGRVFITMMVGVAATGLYMVGFQVAMVVELLATSFNKAYAPWLYRHLRDGGEEMKIYIVKLTYAYFAAVVLSVAVLAVVLPRILSLLVGERFAGAAEFTTWIAIGFGFSAMYYMVANYLFYAGAPRLLAWVTAVSCLLSLGFNYGLVRVNGAVGAAQALALTLMVTFLLTWLASARVFPMPWRLRRSPSLTAAAAHAGADPC